VRNGEVTVSANRFIKPEVIDKFVLSKADWIERAMQIRQVYEDKWRDEDCLEYFNAISDEICLNFANIKKPEIKVRLMKSKWGVCNLKKHTITLNKMLMDKPKEAVEYVIMHEYVHFLHPDHQKGFHKKMKELMPDYKIRKRLL